MTHERSHQTGRLDKVVFVGLTDYSNAPTRIRCYNFARMLSEAGYDVEVFSFQEHLAPPELKNQEMTVMINVPEETKESLVDQAVPLLERMGPALFIIQKTHYHAAAVIEVCRRHGWPYALDYDDDDRGRSSLFKDPEVSMRRFGVSGQVNVLSRLAGEARFCIASSEALRGILSAWNSRVHLVETAADTDLFTFVERRERSVPRMVWLGQVWGKRILECLDLACRAARRVYREGVPFSLHVVGRGMEEDLVRHLDTSYPGLPISFDGWVEPDDVPGLLASMDIGLFPLVPISLDYEWMRAKSPTKLFEYMATGLPVIATRLGEVVRLGLEGEAFLLASSEREMAGMMHRLLTDPSLRRSMGARAASEIAQGFSLRAATDKLAAILNEAGVVPAAAGAVPENQHTREQIHGL